MAELRGALEKAEEYEDATKKQEHKRNKKSRGWFLPAALGFLLAVIPSAFVGLREFPVRVFPGDYDGNGQPDFYIERGLFPTREELYSGRFTKEQDHYYVRINLKDNVVSRRAIQERARQATSFGWGIDAHRF